ncbi:hypothetical protein AB0C11_34180 [Streptomyces sp. NPDC039016]|uniref:hypothetical protein n=1 Tax=Streptomyces sp. NPDC039016 TaxID=3154330 RepID=UPI0033FB7538
MHTGNPKTACHLPNSLESAPCWAVWAAHLTALAVLPSGLWRLAMVAGHPAGYTAEGFVPFDTAGAKVWMLALSVFSELAALLTIGLVRPWGEVVPRRVPLLGGRTVHPVAAAVPAGLGALALTVLWARVPWWWSYPHADMTPTGNIVVGILYQPLFLWGPLLGAVTVSYWRRRRRSSGEGRSRARGPVGTGGRR